MERKIPKKNYIIYAIIVVVTLALVLYMNEWYKAYKQKQLDESYIAKHINEVNYEEFKYISRENPNLIIYIGKTNCKECIKLEKNLYKIIDKNELKDEMIFLNVTALDNINRLSDYSREELNLNYNVPSIAILKDSKITDVLNSNENKEITDDLIVQLLEEYEYIK